MKREKTEWHNLPVLTPAHLRAVSSKPKPPVSYSYLCLAPV